MWAARQRNRPQPAAQPSTPDQGPLVARPRRGGTESPSRAGPSRISRQREKERERQQRLRAPELLRACAHLARRTRDAGGTGLLARVGEPLPLAASEPARCPHAATPERNQKEKNLHHGTPPLFFCSELLPPPLLCVAASRQLPSRWLAAPNSKPREPARPLYTPRPPPLPPPSESERERERVCGPCVPIDSRPRARSLSPSLDLSHSLPGPSDDLVSCSTLLRRPGAARRAAVLASGICSHGRAAVHGLAAELRLGPATTGPIGHAAALRRRPPPPAALLLHPRYCTHPQTHRHTAPHAKSELMFLFAVCTRISCARAHAVTTYDMSCLAFLQGRVARRRRGAAAWWRRRRRRRRRRTGTPGPGTRRRRAGGWWGRGRRRPPAAAAAGAATPADPSTSPSSQAGASRSSTTRRPGAASAATSSSCPDTAAAAAATATAAPSLPAAHTLRLMLVHAATGASLTHRSSLYSHGDAAAACTRVLHAGEAGVERHMEKNTARKKKKVLGDKRTRTRDEQEICPRQKTMQVWNTAWMDRPRL